MNISSAVEGARWYVIYTKSRHEKKVNSLLIERNITSFLPEIKVVKQWSDRKRKLLAPMFPNYLFVQINSRDLWKVKSLPGVIGIVGQRNENGPSPVPEKVIQSIHRLMQGEVNVSNVPFRQGDRVRVVAGPFLGVEGMFIQSCNKNMLFVEVELIRRTIWVELNPSHLEKSWC